ncbi:MFS transporter [Ligilactobacillus saerimneri]|uniref:MFS transporter n=1 Tax=Ligilactobacillus saerimneri TaxID=228229 RepID=A0A7H9EI87_9LACO|nr:MFS transporter [Ligilactobacillus saerimneri]QLL77413.1 MFS transporter [Ligilactobacillus saerimneri]
METGRGQLLKVSLTTLINALGATIFTYVLSLKLLTVTGSAIGYGVNIFIGPVVGMIFAPLIGKIIDTYSKKKIAILAELGLIISLLTFLEVYPYVQNNLLYVAIGFTCFNNLCARFFTISYLSSAPDLVEKSQLQRLNVVQTTGVAITNMIALPIAGFLYGLIPFERLIWIEIVTELLTLLLTRKTKFKVTKSNLNIDDHDKTSIISILNKHVSLLELIIVVMILNFAITSIEIGVPYTIVKLLKKSTTISGNIQGLFSLGIVIGGGIISIISLKDVLVFTRRIYNTFTLMLVIFGISIYWLPNYTLEVFAIFELSLGFMTAISDPPLFTYIQKEIPREYLGRINTYLYTSVQLLTPLGVAVYSSLFELLSYQQVYLISGVFVLLVVSIVKKAHLWLR